MKTSKIKQLNSDGTALTESGHIIQLGLDHKGHWLELHSSKWYVKEGDELKLPEDDLIKLTHQAFNKTQLDELEQLSKPLIRWIRDNCNPHQQVSISWAEVEINESTARLNFTKFEPEHFK